MLKIESEIKSGKICSKCKTWKEFNLLDEKELLEAANWSNIFPMWQKENLIKNKKIIVLNYEI